MITPINSTTGACTPGDHNNATTSTVDMTGATHFVVCVGMPNGNDEPTISDTAGNTNWVRDELVSSLVSGDLRVYRCANALDSANYALTLNSVQANFFGIVVHGFSGVKTTSPLDANSNSNVQNGVSSIQPGSMTPTEDGEVVYTGIVVHTSGNNPSSIDSGFTRASVAVSADNFGVGGAYKVQTSAGAENPTWSITPAADDPATVIFAYKAEPTGGAAIILTGEGEV